MSLGKSLRYCRRGAITVSELCGMLERACCSGVRVQRFGGSGRLLVFEAGMCFCLGEAAGVCTDPASCSPTAWPQGHLSTRRQLQRTQFLCSDSSQAFCFSAHQTEVGAA